ncbi:MAG: hypothetical protein L0H38_03725 [bacterium]|nr:hypothetical protein [bacterium]
MENLSKNLTNGDDPIIEIMPRIEGAQIEEVGNYIIDVLGSDRSNEERTMHEAEWCDEQDSKYRLKRYVQDDSVRLSLDVYKSLQNDEPFLSLSYVNKNGKYDACIFDPEATERKRLAVDKSVVRQEILENLATSGLVSIEKATTEAEDAKYWDIALASIAERQDVLWAAKRGQDSPVNQSSEHIYDEVREVIEKIEPDLPMRAVNRIIDQALAQVYPNDLPELPPASSDAI